MIVTPQAHRYDAGQKTQSTVTVHEAEPEPRKVIYVVEKHEERVHLVDNRRAVGFVRPMR